MAAVFHATRAVDFDGLYRRHAPSVYRYTFAVLGNHADAEDVTQQTFLNAYRACAQGTKPRKAENWLLRIAHNEVRRHFRTRQRKALEVEFDEEVGQPEAERSEPSLADVLRALRRLPPTQRSALVMREFEGRSYAEMAQIMGLTQSALESHIFRARRALAEQLDEAFTCGEAEDALLRRLDGRLPRRLARHLKAHLHECRACVRFADVQKRQRAVLRGLSVMPIPASLFLFRPDQAAAGAVGPTAVAASGSAAVGGGTAAGAGGAALGAGFVAKAAAVTAAAAVAGGAGYGVSTGPDPVARDDRKVASARVVSARPDGRSGAEISGARAARDRPDPAPLIARASRKLEEAEPAPRKPAARAETFASPQARGKRRGGPRTKTPPGHETHPVPPAAAKAKPTARRNRPRPAVGNEVANGKPARQKPTRPARPPDKLKPSPGAKPTPPRNAGPPKPFRGKPAPAASSPSGRTEAPAGPPAAGETTADEKQARQGEKRTSPGGKPPELNG